MKNEINKIREKLYKEMESRNNDYKKVVRISEELDKLIVAYYSQEGKG